MKIINLLREVLCQALLASHLTRRGRWQSAVRLMGK
jgi:hypothetical protein